MLTRIGSECRMPRSQQLISAVRRGCLQFCGSPSEHAAWTPTTQVCAQLCHHRLAYPVATPCPSFTPANTFISRAQRDHSESCQDTGHAHAGSMRTSSRRIIDKDMGSVKGAGEEGQARHPGLATAGSPYRPWAESTWWGEALLASARPAAGEGA